MSTHVAVRERPILFRPEMVRAILDGRKTQTRRLIKPQPPKPVGIAKFTEVLDPFHEDAFKGTPAERCVGSKGPRLMLWYAEDYFGNLIMELGRCPYGRPGDRLWVRETWREVVHDGINQVVYRADNDPCPCRPWRPSIFMPRSACRLELEVVKVRVERLDDISNVDAIAEGVLKRGEDDYRINWAEDYARFVDAAGAFREGFRMLNGIGPSRVDNPWVWAIEFRVLA